VPYVERVIADVALVRCCKCGRRFRALPCDAIPHKHYGATVIDRSLTEHVDKSRPAREVAADFSGEKTPAASTIFAWREGMGAYFLGRAAGEVPGTSRSDELLEASARRCAAGVAERIEKLQKPVGATGLDEYRERLEGCARFLACSRLVTGFESPWSLLECSRSTSAWGLARPWSFRTGLLRTRFEHTHARGGPESPSPEPTEQRPWRVRTRSPPSGLR